MEVPIWYKWVYAQQDQCSSIAISSRAASVEQEHKTYFVFVNSVSVTFCSKKATLVLAPFFYRAYFWAEGTVLTRTRTQDIC
jgi:hypothetical protein